MAHKLPISALLENIRSLHNVGSIFRSSDGAGVEQLFLTGYTGTPPREQISKTALGAELEVPWKHYKYPLNIVRQLKKKGVQIVALETGEQSEDIYEFQPKWPICLMVGNEVEGLSAKLREEADVLIRIPMLGVKESLNVSCAYSVAVYELARKYTKEGEDDHPRLP
ncbi:MAG: RNA methyltransferase [Candidatus Altimarinota bacterium]